MKSADAGRQFAGRRPLFGWLVCGVAVWSLGVSARAEEAVRLSDEPVETIDHKVLTVPRDYGRLVNIVISNDVHYLYFEDEAGTIRIVLVGPRGALPRARAPFQLLSPEAKVIKRGVAMMPAVSR